MTSDAPSHVLPVLSAQDSLGGLYRVPLGPCSRGNHFATRKKEERIGGNRKKEAH